MELTVITKKPDRVTTITGKVLPRQNVKLIGGQYYERNVDVFHIKNNKGVLQWYRKESGKIALNIETNTWDLISRLESNPDLVRGYADKSGQLVFFKRNLYKNVLLLTNMQSSPFEAIICKSADLAKELGYIECIFNEFWYKKDCISVKEIKLLNTKKKLNYTDKVIDYNANQYNKTYLQTLQQYEENKAEIEIEDSTKEILPYLDRYSFGIEFESSTGTVPSNLLGFLGLLPVKDGSIGGYEYTTIPLSGVEGLQTLKLACKELSKRCLVDHKCSMHIHIGNIERTKLFLTAFYIMCYKIQNEMYDLFPEYKRDQVTHLGSKKNYCQPLPSLNIINNTIYKDNGEPFEKKLDVYFGKIFEYLSGGCPEDKRYNFNAFRHPQDENGKQKWNRTERYKWINLIPAIFDKSKTLELRLHTPTFNFTKVSNWLFIFVAMIRFCEIFKDQIIARTIEYDLKTILEGYKNRFGSGSVEDVDKKGYIISSYLNAYVKSRKETFHNAKEKGDVLCMTELSEDSLYEFQHAGIKTLY